MNLLEQVRTMDQKRLREHRGCRDKAILAAVDRGLIVSLGMKNIQKEKTAIDTAAIKNESEQGEEADREEEKYG